MAGDKSQKTEKATPHQVKKAREEGRFPSAKDFVAAMQFTAFVFWIDNYGSDWVQQLGIAFRIVMAGAFHRDITAAALIPMLIEVTTRCFRPLGSLAAVLLGITFAFQLLVTGFGLSLKNLTPSLKRLNPANKWKQIKRQNLPSFVQALFLLPVFGYTVYAIVSGHLNEYFNLPAQNLSAAIHVVTGSFMNLFWKASGAFIVFGLVNLLRQRREFSGDMKMSKQDIKDESKQNDGNPQIKSRVRRLQRDLRRRNMMQDVPKATAIIVNPTHYAVAIRYKMSSMAAPTVLAKGKNYLALRIRQLANDHQIPIIETAPLAQALYKSAEVGQEIPSHLFKAVAEVLAYIYRLMKGRLPGQDD
jgi:flagellar biosynthetic protein FlhB